METTNLDTHTLAAADRSTPRLVTPTVAVWALLASLAVAYLAVLAVRPVALATYLPSAVPADLQDKEGQRANTATVGETQDLRDALGKVEADVAKIKTDLSEQSSRDTALETRLAVLEDLKRGTVVAATAPSGTAAPAAATPAPGKTSPAKTTATELVPGVPVTVLAPALTAAAKAAAKKAAAGVSKAAQAVVPSAAPATVTTLAPALAPVPATLVPETPLAAPATALTQAENNAAAVLAPPLENPSAASTTAGSVAGVKLINAPLSASSAAARAAPVPAPNAVPTVAPAISNAAPAIPSGTPAATPANAAQALAPAFETGSVQNLDASTAAATTGGKPVGIYIGSGPSVDSLRLSWSLLADRNADSLRNLEPRYTTGIDANGLNYGLVAGPVKSAADAQKLCKDLAAKAVTCRVGDFAGEAL